jgi:U3 small nucleolar RNA-associated protein 7
MCQNPANAVIALGHSKGIVTMWTPNVREPVAKMLVHRQPVTSVAIDRFDLPEGHPDCKIS